METLNFRLYLFGEEVFLRLSELSFQHFLIEDKPRMFTENFDKMMLAIRIFLQNLIMDLY